MNAGRDFLLITIRSTGSARFVGIPKLAWLLAGFLWLLIVWLVWVTV